MAWTREIVSAYRRHPNNSQQDWERYLRGYLMLLDKLYARVDLPPAVHGERSALYAHYHVVGACHAYRAGQIQTGQDQLLKAAALMPGIIQGTPPPVASTILGFAQSDGNTDPAALIDTIFRGLPPQWARLRSYRRYALSALHMRRVFTAHAARTQPRFRDWLLGVCQHPRWLVNRGVVGRSARDIVLRSAPADKVQSCR